MDFQQSFYSRTNQAAPQSSGGRNVEPGPKQFVFIDESQRDSKRLKITRACESCRRRKVKCDAPHVAPGDSCTSCRRLNVECIMQQAGLEDERPASERSQLNYETEDRSQRSGRADYQARDLGQSVLATPANSSPRSMTGSDSGVHLRLKPPSSGARDRRGSSNAGTRPTPISTPVSMPSGESSFASTTTTTAVQTNSDSLLSGENTLTDIFGNLNIALSGRAPFVDDVEHNKGLPPYNTETFHKNLVGYAAAASPDYPVTFEEIEEFLPPEDLAAALIGLYFENVHPYLPIINKTLFYRDWMSVRRRQMSPYFLLCFFAGAARYSKDSRVLMQAGDPYSAGDLWYSLACKYKDDFLDAPRMSTLQAEVINLKALETRPKIRGYSYRSWNLLSQILRMGKDLGLNRMTQQHAHDADSITGRRLWQICLIMDQMMGTAQGRELQLDMVEVDLTLLPSAQQSLHELDPAEVRLHNDFVYMTGLIKILRRCTEVHSAVGIKFPFSAEPQYPALSEILVRWRENLPEHLRFESMTRSVLPSHFVAHLHISYYMCVSLLHRPWIVSAGEYGATGEWRGHLRVCKDASRQALRLYELLLDQYGAPGIKWMIRGNNYAMYGAVIMTMIHAVCVTCPEREFSEGARENFNRAIKVLDRLAEINSTPQMQKQMNVLKGIFGSPLPSGQPKFDTRSLPPELASLQEQYMMMQDADARRRERSQMRERHEPPQRAASYGTEYQTNTGDYNGLQSYPVMQEDTYYQNLPMGVDNTMGLHSSEHLSAETDHSQHSGTSPNQMAWNPAGLIGAWNLNFPLASSGFEYIDQNFGMHDSSIAMHNQGPIQGSHMSQQEYVPFMYTDGYQQTRV